MCFSFPSSFCNNKKFQLTMVISQYYEPLNREASLVSRDSRVSSGESSQEVNDDSEDEFEISLELTQQELVAATQLFNLFDDDDDDKIAEGAPEPIDFSRVEPFTQEDEKDKEKEECDGNDLVLEPSSKRFRSDTTNNNHAATKDTPDKWYLEDGTHRKIFKRGEQFTLQCPLGDPEFVYTIQEFYIGANLQKMARCVCDVLVQKTFIGQNRSNFDKRAFVTEHGKYVRCRYSQDKPLRKLKHRITQKLPEPKLFYENPPQSESKAWHGWGFAYSPLESFDGGCGKIPLSRPAALDMFAGAGGSGVGLKNAGFVVTHAVEKDRMAAATIKLNHGEETTVFCQPVETFLQEAKRAQPGSPYYCVDVAHCHCSSPCQGFSLVNTGGSEEVKDANNKLCHTFPEIVITSKMTTGTFENVAGILQQERVHYVQEMFETFIKNNYKARLAVMDSAFYGDPQHRIRVVIFVSKAPNPLPEFPAPTHGPGLEPFVTARDVIEDLEQVEPRDGPGILVLPNGMKVDHHIKSGQEVLPDGDTLKADAPSHTLTCSHGVRHYSLPRACTNLECARLQGFDDDWQFCGSRKEVQKQIGNAVPVGLATAIANAIGEAYSFEDDIDFWTESPDESNSLLHHNSRRVTLG